MTSEPTRTTLVTPDMEARKGVWSGERVSYPVTETDIRRWAIASYWPDTPPRLFWDPKYAAATRWGGIIAPEDFNPFAWPVPMPRPLRDERPAAAEANSGPPVRMMNGGLVDTFHAPIRPGEVITSRIRLKDWNERETRLGLTLFSDTETEWRNQKGEIVKTRVQTAIRY